MKGRSYLRDPLRPLPRLPRLLLRLEAALPEEELRLPEELLPELFPDSLLRLERLSNEGVERLERLSNEGAERLPESRLGAALLRSNDSLLVLRALLREDCWLRAVLLLLSLLSAVRPLEALWGFTSLPLLRVPRLSNFCTGLARDVARAV